jgi:hypothetical protein
MPKKGMERDLMPWEYEAFVNDGDILGAIEDIVSRRRVTMRWCGYYSAEDIQEGTESLRAKLQKQCGYKA